MSNLNLNISFLIKIALAIGIFITVLGSYNWFTKRSLKLIESTSTISGYNARKTSLRYMIAIIRIIIFIIYGIFLFVLFDIPGSTIVSFFGLLGVATSLLLREILLDYVFGFIILIEGKVRIDDEVVVEGFRGTVETIELRTSRVRDQITGDVFIVSNRHFTKFIKKKNQKGYIIEASIQGTQYEEVASSIQSHYLNDAKVKKIDVQIVKYNTDKMEIQIIVDTEKYTYKQLRQEILQIINEV